MLLCAAVMIIMTGSLSAGNLSSEYEIRPEIRVAINSGYFGGLGFHANGMISNFARDFPLSISLGIGYTKVQAGDPAAARRIFINNATNGIPEKSGRQWDFRMDFSYPVKLFSLKRASAYAGPRHIRFTGNFKYVGGNEDFDIVSNQWGIGAGLVNRFAISPIIDMVITTGIDYYFSSTLTGHDTSYSPDGTDINGREDYTYDDANDAVNQPRFEPRLMLGFSYRF